MGSRPKVVSVRACAAASAFCLIVGSVAWGGPLPTTTPEAVGLSSERLQRISTRLQQDVDEGVYPGAVVLVARRGKIAYFESFGWRDKDSGAPMPKDAIFRIFSMTKPIVSVAAMMLHEEGRFFLWEPVEKYLPAFKDMKLGVEGPVFSTVPTKRKMTIHDLLRHTSGLTYEERAGGSGPKSVVKAMYREAGVGSRDQTSDEMVEKLGKLPLVYEPGTRWEYGRSTDVLGRLIEVVSGMPLDRLLEEGIFEPLGMVDSGFWVGAEKKNRVAQPGHVEQLQFDPTVKPRLLSGGGGAVATASDYARFMQMLLNGGELDGTRLLSPKTVEHMTSDHLGPVPGIPEFWDGYTGHGFGLGFLVRLENGRSPVPGTRGNFSWGGWAGTVFWADPTEELIAVGMVQEPSKRRYFQQLVRNLVYQSIID